MQSHNPFASPQALAPPSVDPATGAAIWRSGNLLVVGADQALPDRCVRCNAPAEGYQLRRKLVWYPAWAYLGLLGGIIPFVLLALITQKRLTTYVGLCPAHRGRRRRAITLGWLSPLAGVFLMIVAGSVRTGAGFLLLGGLLLILGGGLCGALLARTVWPKRIREGRAWIKGVCPQLLAEFAEYGL